jgi:membrane protease YdiL (CAAX protease family)
MIKTTDWIHPVELGERRFLHPGPLLWLRALSWCVGLFSLVALLSHGVSKPLGAVWDELPKPLIFLAHLAEAAACLGAYALLVWLAEGRKPSELALRGLAPQFGAGLLIGVAIFVAVMGILLLSGLYDIKVLGPASPWVNLGDTLKSGVNGQLMIGGMLIRLVWRAFGPWAAFVALAVLFGFNGIGNPRYTVFAAAAFVAGASSLVAFYVLTGRLWMSMGVQGGLFFSQYYLFGARMNYGQAITTSAPNR